VIVDSWLNKFPESLIEKSKKLVGRLKQLFTLIDPCIDYMRKNVKEIVTTMNNNLV